VYGLSLKQEIDKTSVVESANFIAGPIVPQRSSLHPGIINGPGMPRNLVGLEFVMGLRREYVRLLSTKIVEDLIKQEMIEVPEDLDLADQLFQVKVMDVEINLEDRINEEVRGLLNQYQDQMRQSGASYQEMFKLIKNKLVRERKLVL
jgi:hypothetical protein